MKKVKGEFPRDITNVINEAKIMASLKSDELTICIDLYNYKETVYIMLEYMDQGSMSNIVTKFHHRYSEDFCRYSLYKVIKGLKKMHDNNVLHRDIKSDNILHSRKGDVKITDLGLACYLSANRTRR